MWWAYVGYDGWRGSCCRVGQVGPAGTPVRGPSWCPPCPTPSLWPARSVQLQRSADPLSKAYLLVPPPGLGVGYALAGPVTAPMAPSLKSMESPAPPTKGPRAVKVSRGLRGCLMISEPWRMWGSTELSGPYSLQPVPASTRPLSGQVTEAPASKITWLGPDGFSLSPARCPLGGESRRIPATFLPPASGQLGRETIQSPWSLSWNVPPEVVALVSRVSMNACHRGSGSA